jgi:hypothetical protein
MDAVSHHEWSKSAIGVKNGDKPKDEIQAKPNLLNLISSAKALSQHCRTKYQTAQFRHPQTMAFPRAIHQNLGPGLSPREAAADAINRFALALDLNDAEVMRSAFTNDSILDKSGLTKVMGGDLGADNGIEEILKATLAHVGPMDSSHHLSNFRVKLNSEQTEAEVMCHALAQHFRGGDGSNPSKPEYLLFGNIYYADVVKDGQGDDALWKIKRIGMHNLWCEGDIGVVG